MNISAFNALQVVDELESDKHAFAVAVHDQRKEYVLDLLATALPPHVSVYVVEEGLGDFEGIADD